MRHKLPARLDARQLPTNDGGEGQGAPSLTPSVAEGSQTKLAASQLLLVLPAHAALHKLRAGAGRGMVRAGWG